MMTRRKPWQVFVTRTGRNTFNLGVQSNKGILATHEGNEKATIALLKRYLPRLKLIPPLDRSPKPAE